jgi:hypothetical protein
MACIVKNANLYRDITLHENVVFNRNEIKCTVLLPFLAPSRSVIDKGSIIKIKYKAKQIRRFVVFFFWLIVIYLRYGNDTVTAPNVRNLLTIKYGISVFVYLYLLKLTPFRKAKWD